MAKRKRPAVRGIVIPWPGYVQREGVEALVEEKEVGVEKVGVEKEVEKEVADPSRNVRKVDIRARGMTKQAAQREAAWTAHLNAAKQWKQTKGRFAKSNKKDKIESSLYQWLKNCVPGGRCYTKERWERLNETFGEGWEKECFPKMLKIDSTGKGMTKREAKWDAILEEVLKFMRINGMFPKGWSGDKNEVRLYRWLYNNADTTSGAWTRERHDKLIAALGERWQSECFSRRKHDLVELDLSRP